MFSCKYGKFSEDGYEYIINTPKTPYPWSNIISNKEYSILITQTGSGYSWGRNSIENRITRFNEDILLDDMGKYFYIKDEETGDIWGFTYKPTNKCGGDYKVIYGLGYAIFTHTYNGIRSSLKVSLSKDDKVEFYHLSLFNESGRKRSLSIFSYAEPYISTFPEENREFHKIFMYGEFRWDLNALVSGKKFWGILDKDKTFNNRDYKYLFFVSSNKKISSYEVNRENFIGMYGSLKNPKGVYEGLTSKDYKNINLGVSISIKLNLKEDSFDEFYIYMGVCEKEDLKKTLRKYKEETKIKKEMDSFISYVRELVDRSFISTEDKSIDFMVNLWCKYQTLMCRLFGKASYYQINKGMGYRDAIQDSLIYLDMDPKLLRNQILFQGKMQFIKGSAPHFFLDESETIIDTNSSDDHLWLIYVAIIYIKESPDTSILNEKIPYIDSPNEESLYVHMKRGILYSLSTLGENHIPSILNHDWNDAISNFKGESVFVGEFLYLVMKEFLDICDIMEDEGFKYTLTSYMKLIKESLNKFCYNGRHFLRCISKDIVMGDHEIFLIPQVFSVIGDITPYKREVMEEVYNKLNTKYGLKILDPPYTKINKSIGYITRYEKGVRENGSIYYHSCTWGILAFLLLGEIDKSFEIINNINPINKRFIIDKYKIEPYVMPSNVEGDYSDNFGRGNWSFNTGSSVWFHRIITRYVLGVRGSLQGLMIDPKPFRHLNEFYMRTTFNKSLFNIYFKRSKEFKIYVNSELIEGNIIRDIKEGEVYEVHVFIK